MDGMVSLTAAQLQEAATLKGQIEEMQGRLQALLGGAPVSETTATGAPRKRTLSPQAIAKIRKGQKARWAKFHAEQATAAAPAPVAPAPAAPAPAPAVAA